MPPLLHSFPTRRSSDLKLVDLVNLINPLLVGGYARPFASGIAVGSDIKGKASSVTVNANAGLGFAANTTVTGAATAANTVNNRSEEHTSELQSRPHLVCPHSYILSLHDALPISNWSIW